MAKMEELWTGMIHNWLVATQIFFGSFTPKMGEDSTHFEKRIFCKGVETTNQIISPIDFLRVSYGVFFLFLMAFVEMLQAKDRGEDLIDQLQEPHGNTV